MITIEVRGFQSIASATIQVEGFTSLVGKSNIGKSAFVRAVRCALTNPTGTSFVRHGRDCARQSRKNAKTCDCSSSVHMVMEGFDLLWEKGDKVNRYTFNGQEYDKPDRGVPDFLAGVGLSLVKVGDKTGSIQVADQFYPIFLLDQSGPAIAEAISDVSQLDSINAATRLVEKERREVQATKKVRESDIKELATKLTLYDTLDEKLVLVAEAEKALLSLSAQRAKAQTLERFLGALEALKVELTALTQAAKVEVPEIACVEKLGSSVVKQKALLVDLTRRTVEVGKLSGLDTTLQSVPSDNPLPGPLSSLLRVQDWMVGLRRLKASFSSFTVVSALDVPDTDALGTVSLKLKQLLTFSGREKTVVGSVRELESAVSKLEAEENTLAQELVPLNKALSEIEVCPSCTRPLKESHSHVESFVYFPD
jgi:hypothetical protein